MQPPPSRAGVHRGRRSRAWCFTLNNPREGESGPEIVAKLNASLNLVYVVCQLEQGTQLTQHLQGQFSALFPIFCSCFAGYIYVKNAISMDTLRRVFNGRAHLEVARGSPQQNRHYCTKPVDGCDCDHCHGCPPRLGGPWEEGAIPTPGKRKDIDDAADLVLSEGFRAAVNRYPGVVARYPSGLLRLEAIRLADTQRDPDVTTVLLLGPPGAGKSYWARQQHPAHDMYVHSIQSQNNWFDGYTGQDAILFDDFAGSASGMKLDFLLQLLDVYAIRVEIKCSHSHILSHFIYITSNIHPYHWYGWSGREIQYHSLLRRFHHIIIMDEQHVPHDLRGQEYLDFVGGSFGPMPHLELYGWRVGAGNPRGNENLTPVAFPPIPRELINLSQLPSLTLPTFPPPARRVGMGLFRRYGSMTQENGDEASSTQPTQVLPTVPAAPHPDDTDEQSHRL